MGLKLVIERECSRDHQTALRQFLCCEPGGPEWAMDPQRYIRDLSVRKTPKGIMRTLLVVSGDIPLHDDVVGFCEYGVAVETTDEHEGVYQISYIATALKVRGTHLGDTLLSSVIVRLLIINNKALASGFLYGIALLLCHGHIFFVFEFADTVKHHIECLYWKTVTYCAKPDELRQSDWCFIAHFYIPNTAISYFTLGKVFHFAVRSAQFIQQTRQYVSCRVVENIPFNLCYHVQMLSPDSS